MGVSPLNKSLIELVVEWNESRELLLCQGANPNILRFLDPVVADDSAGLYGCPAETRDEEAPFCCLRSLSS